MRQVANLLSPLIEGREGAGAWGFATCSTIACFHDCASCLNQGEDAKTRRTIMVPWRVASRLKWLSPNVLRKYRRILDYFEDVQHKVSDIDIAEMFIKLGDPLRGIEILRLSEANVGTDVIRRKILLSRALWSMRMPQAAGYLLFASQELSTSYDMCLELARIDCIIGLSSNSQKRKQHLEAASSTLKHCIRLSPERPEAYVLHGCIMALYPEWQELARHFCDRFENLISQTNDIPLDWFTLFDAFDLNYKLGNIQRALHWLARLQQLLDKSPWVGDRFAFHSLAYSSFNLGDMKTYEEGLQLSWLLYPSKGGDLLRFYLRRGYFFRTTHMLWLAFRCTDLREYRIRLELVRNKGSDARQILTDLTGVSL